MAAAVASNAEQDAGCGVILSRCHRGIGVQVIATQVVGCAYRMRQRGQQRSVQHRDQEHRHSFPLRSAATVIPLGAVSVIP